MYADYKDRVAFYVIYIQEAHATDGWQLPANVQQQVLFADPRNAAERAEVASACLRNLKIDIPALLDDERNTTERAYTGWPDRLYLVDERGRVVYKTKPGPFGFKVDGLAAELKSLVERKSEVRP